MFGKYMNAIFQKIKHIHQILNTRYYTPLAVVSGILVFILTFFSMEADCGVGLDSSYLWGMNYLFANEYETLTHLVYPFGPLALFKIPLALSNNLLYYTIFYYILTFSFITLFFYISKKKGFSLLTTLILCYCALILIRIDYMIVFVCAMLSFIAIKKKSIPFFCLSSVLATIGLCVKSSIGVESLGVIAVACLVSLYENRNWRYFIFQILAIVVCFLLIGSIVFKGFTSFIYYLYGVGDLVFGYGDSLALYPENSWLLICLGFLLVLSSPLILKDKDATFFLLLSLIPLYSTYKHAFIREDIYHYQQLVFFLIAFWSIMALMNKKRAALSVFCGVLCIGSFYLNARNLGNTEVITKHLKTEHIKSFYNYTFRLKETNERFASLSQQAFQEDSLEQSWKTIIGNSTVDCYPWEHILAGANNLNWKPRKTLGSAVSDYTSKLSQENYDIKTGVDFVIWHFNADDYAKTFDDKYFLNDEPNVTLSLLNNYTCIAKTDKYLLMQRNKDGKQNFLARKNEKSFTASLNQWIKIKQSPNTILRLKISTNKTILGKIKSAMLKGVAYYVDYQTKDGTIYSFRYTSNLAKEGLWINPLVINPFSEEQGKEVSQIRFRTNNDKYIRKSINLQFEEIKINGEKANNEEK